MRSMLLSRASQALRARFGSRKLAKWRSVGILLTYRCNAACADCYENCGPRRRGVMPVEDLRGYLRELRKLGLTGPSLHFAGGEPFYDPRHLMACFEVAKEEGMLPLGKLETNALWCKNDAVTRARLTEIARFGLLELMVSSDAFHQEFIPIERVERAVRIGSEVLGEKRVRVNSWDFLRDPIDVAKLTDEGKSEVFREVLAQRPWRIVGRAASTLAHLVDKHPMEGFAEHSCARKILKRGSIHIDPYGNVFPTTCAGIILGNARRETLSEIHARFEPREHPVVETLVDRGPLPLLEAAIRGGFAGAEQGFATKCHLCFAARGFFWQHGLHADEVGPEDLYAD